MAILVNENTRVLIQGITGKEGSRVAREMLTYGTKVLAGVVPGKGYSKTEEGIPIFDTIAQARRQFPEINASLVVVPAPFAPHAVLEALNERIPLINILTEGIPVARVAEMLARARATGVRLIGPSSVGIISPGKCKLGSIGGGGLDRTVFTSGPVGVVSKSGGMTAEISRILTEKGFGQSTAVGIGGDVLIGSNFLSLAHEFEKDPETEVVVIFGEIGGVYEIRFAEALARGEIQKPVVALIAGLFAESLPHGTPLGHAGAIVGGGNSSASEKIHALKKAGAHVVDAPEEIPAVLELLLHSR